MRTLEQMSWKRWQENEISEEVKIGRTPRFWLCPWEHAEAEGDGHRKCKCHAALQPGRSCFYQPQGHLAASDDVVERKTWRKRLKASVTRGDRVSG